MKKITALRAGRSRGKRVNVFLDGRFAFSLQAGLAAKEGLQTGQELSSSQIEALAGSDCFQRCLDAASRYLSYRLRSESELRRRLQQRGFDSAFIEPAIARLKEQGLVDDAAFAQFWKDDRQSFSPRSRRLTGLELRRKGVSAEIIDSVVDKIDDSDSAYLVAITRARRLSVADYQDFRRRLGDHLRRRGFDYEVVNHTIERVWQECGSSSG